MVFMVMVRNQNRAITARTPLIMANSEPIKVGCAGANGSTATWPMIITIAWRERSLGFWEAAAIVW
ncbi:hypothetical protein ALQ56_200435 [Pseudomonas syringae pv. papulans]|nr:hypothetical protein ALQ56_200435 [Pseudomonas syringae pv. papulans]